MFEQYLNSIGEYGIISQIQHPLITIRGLPQAHPNEMLIFENGQIGMVYDIDEKSLHALIFSQTPASLGSKVTRTNITMAIPASENLLGRIIDPLTNIMSASSTAKYVQEQPQMRDLFIPAPGISRRVPITSQFLTGVSKVDLLIPLGYGQRELIMGDVKTGKTMFLSRTIINQVKNHDSIVIYAAIGKKRTEIITLYEYFQKEGIIDKICIVATTASDIASTIYLTPYTAITLAEFFRDKGQNVLVVMDDLTTHAQRYREIALKSRRFPGRESFPGDIFYTHASLLERAGHFTHETTGTVSITCLPVAMTTEGDITGYISTNLMSMTDGHIFFDSAIYNKGERPAINIPLSVTRVGRQAQSQLGKEINKTILSTMTEYEKIKNIAYIGSELSEVSKSILKKGESLMNLLNQDMLIDLPYELQLVLFGLVWINELDLSSNKSYNMMIPELMKIYTDENRLGEVRLLLDSPTMKDFLDGLKKNQQLINICKIVKQ
ncbi:F0F1 ATP synthase subunit alpha [Candidatus Woesebacteria bacterium]|nr:F0F1 ATP synthase subunit alpha [Candidatus Woesebacteria bacterium]